MRNRMLGRKAVYMGQTVEIDGVAVDKGQPPKAFLIQEQWVPAYDVRLIPNFLDLILFRPTVFPHVENWNPFKETQ